MAALNAATRNPIHISIVESEKQAMAINEQNAASNATIAITNFRKTFFIDRTISPFEILS